MLSCEYSLRKKINVETLLFKIRWVTIKFCTPLSMPCNIHFISNKGTNWKTEKLKVILIGWYYNFRDLKNVNTCKNLSKFSWYIIRSLVVQHRGAVAMEM